MTAAGLQRPEERRAAAAVLAELMAGAEETGNAQAHQALQLAMAALTTEAALRLPSGVKEVSTEDFGVGDVLVVAFASGYTLTIDALQLAEHECQVVVHPAESRPGVSNEDLTADPIAGVAFGGEAPSAWAGDGHVQAAR